MATLPTVTLRRASDGNEIIVNQTDYARDIDSYVAKGYKIVTTRRGDATDEQVAAAARESDIELARSRDPARERKFGDKARAAADQALHNPSSELVAAIIETAKAADEATKEHTPETGEGERPESAPSPGSDVFDAAWESVKGLTWPKARKHVKEMTGTVPDNWDHAEQLVRNRPRPE